MSSYTVLMITVLPLSWPTVMVVLTCHASGQSATLLISLYPNILICHIPCKYMYYLSLSSHVQKQLCPYVTKQHHVLAQAKISLQAFPSLSHFQWSSYLDVLRTRLCFTKKTEDTRPSSCRYCVFSNDHWLEGSECENSCFYSSILSDRNQSWIQVSQKLAKF